MKKIEKKTKKQTNRPKINETIHRLKLLFKCVLWNTNNYNRIASKPTRFKSENIKFAAVK